MSNNLLSKAELRVMEALNQKMLYKEIAAEKGISINTVKKHLKNIYRKMEVKNRKGACEEFTKDYAKELSKTGVSSFQDTFKR